MQQIVKWTIHHGSDPEMLDPTMPEVTDECKEEVESTFRRLYDIIATSKEGFNSGAQVSDKSSINTAIHQLAVA